MRRSRDGGATFPPSAALRVVALCAAAFVVGRWSAGGSAAGGDVPAPRRAAASRSSPPPPAPRAVAHGVTGAPTVWSGVDVQVLSLAPRAFFFPGFLDAASAAALAAEAVPRMTQSTLALKPGEKAEDVANVRTSWGAFMTHGDDASGVLARLEDKVAAVTHVPRSHGEAWNVLRYADGAHYDAHYDYFPPETYGAQASQRLATVLVYLTDVEAGGETCFPLEGADGLARRAAPGFSFKDCSGLVVGPPRAGDALLFYSQHANGTLDPQSLHGGCPVERGVKVVATKWLRDRPHQF